VAKPINIPNVFAAATSAIPLSQLDQDFSTLANATNDLATYSNYVADTGAANAFIANYPVNTNTGSLTTGLRLQFKAANANSGASTLNVQVNGGSIGTAAIRLTDGSALPANTIIAGAMVDVMYDGTNFQLMNDPSGGQEVITNLSLSGNLTVAGTSTFTGNVTGNVVNTTTSTITNLSSGNVTITGGTISNVTLDNVTVDVETFSNITINGTASFAAGTVSAPSITTTGDTNTGIFFPAADTIAFAEGGVEAMRIDSSGNVGINLTPATQFSTVRGLGLAGTNGNPSYITSGGSQDLVLTSNAFLNASGNWTYVNTNAVAQQRMTNGVVSWFNSPSGTSGTTATMTERMRITSDGFLLVGTTSSSTDSGAGVKMSTAGWVAGVRSAAPSGFFNRLTDDGQIVVFKQDGIDEGNISVSGNTVSYNSFAGSHWSQLSDGSKPTILRGTVLESINELVEWPNEPLTERLCRVKISDTAGSKKVYGVFMCWDEEWTATNDMLVTAVGAFVCRINKDVVVQEGDLLESNGDGTARVQADDVMRSSTIGKVTCTVKTHQYADGSYCVPTVLYCG